MQDHFEFRLVLQSDPPLSDEDADRMALSMMSELSAVPSVLVDRAPGDPAPPGAKSDAFNLGFQILVAVSGGVASAAVPSLFHTVNDWLGRQPTGTRILVKHMGATFEISGSESVAADTIAPLIHAMLSTR